jgi:4-amino-4-deoxy-L-arabinose transferase-like glycosyltransferase
LPLLALYVAVQTFRLAETPLLNPDEAAYTEPAWTLLTAGRFGAPMYAGMFAIDERWYFLWPGYAVLAAVPYALLGADVLAVRLLSAAFGALLLAAVWSLTRQVAGAWCPPHASSRAAGATALTAAALALAHPTVLFLSRFGRPEIAVAALAVASSALGARADRGRAQGGGLGWAAGAGAAAALAFLMHQYGAFALVALGVALAWRPPREWRRAGLLALAAGAGAIAVLLPWLLWVGSDWPEFRAQLGAQLGYQRWRYPDGGLLPSLVRDLPARYLLNRQDYPPGWQPWAEAATLLLGPRFLQGPTGPAPLALLKWAASLPLYWGQIGPDGLYRWSVLALLLATLVLLPLTRRAETGQRNPYTMRWVFAPLLVWVLGLATIPNKWEGYTGAVAAYSAAGAALLLPLAGAPGRRRLLVALPLAACAAVWLVADARLLTQPIAPYARLAARLRQAVPAGEPVASSMRDWFAFAGRNPAVTYEFRSVPAFRTSVLRMVAEQRPRYLVLNRRPDPPPGGQRYDFIHPPWEELYAYLDGATELVATIDDPTFGTVEVRRVLAYPT